MLKTRRTRDGWTVFVEGDFSNYHTHVDSKGIAKVIKRNVSNRLKPETRSLRLLHSHLRVTKNKKYARVLMRIIDEVESERDQKKAEGRCE